MIEKEPNEPDAVPEPDEATAELIAYLDGELDARAAEAVEARISIDPKTRTDADALKRTWDLLDHLPRAEPSENFTARTVDRLEPLKQSTASGSMTSNSSPRASTTTLPTDRLGGSRVLKLAAWTVALGFAGFAGWLVQGPAHSYFFPPDEKAQDAQIVENLRILENLKLYRHADDIDFVKELDTPELFGDDAAGQ